MVCHYRKTKQHTHEQRTQEIITINLSIPLLPQCHAILLCLKCVFTQRRCGGACVQVVSNSPKCASWVYQCTAFVCMPLNFHSLWRCTLSFACPPSSFVASSKTEEVGDVLIATNLCFGYAYEQLCAFKRLRNMGELADGWKLVLDSIVERFGFWALCCLPHSMHPLITKSKNTSYGRQFLSTRKNNGSKVRVFIGKSDYFVTSTRDEFSHLSSVKLIFMLPCKYHSESRTKSANAVLTQKVCAISEWNHEIIHRLFINICTQSMMSSTHFPFTFVVFTIHTSFSWLEIVLPFR